MAIGAAVVLLAAHATQMFAPFEQPDSRHCCQHGDVAINIALADVYCGLKNRVFQPPGRLFHGLTDETATKPLRDYVPEALGAADLEAACKAAAPYRNFHEYSVSALMKAALALPPTDTPRSLMEKLRAIVIAMAVIGGALAAFCRIGLVPIYAAYGVALGLTRTLEPYAWADYYYWLPVLLLFMVSVAAAFGAMTARAPLAILTAFALFAFLSFEIAINLRTSYGLAFAIGLGLAACGGFALLVARKTPLKRMAPRLAAIAAAATIATAANPLMFKSFRVADAGSEIEYHLFWHPVVLGLAVPGTDFTRSEGIAWSDAVGVELARRIDPEAPTDGLRYEAAMKTYYMSLWRDHPGEMIGVYWAKLQKFGEDHARYLAVHEFSKWLDEFNIHGVLLLVLLGLAFLGMVYVGLRLGVPEFAFFAGASAVFLVMMQMELVLIYAQFAYTHNGSSLALMLLVLWCVAVAAGLWLTNRFAGPVRVTAEAARQAAKSSLLRPSIAIVSVLILAEVAARLVGGYSLSSIALVRSGETASSGRATIIAPLSWRQGAFGTAAPADTGTERLRMTLWPHPPKAAHAANWRGPFSPLDDKAFTPFRYPRNAELPGGVLTDRHGWRATGDEQADADVKIAFVGSSFTFGEDAMSLPTLVEAKLNSPGAPSTFEAYNLAREGLAQQFFAATILEEAAPLRPDIVVIEDVAPFARPMEFAEKRGKSKKWFRFMRREESWSYHDRVLQRPRPLCAFCNSLFGPERGPPADYYWRFDESAASEAFARKSVYIEEAIAAANSIGAAPIVLGTRSVVRSGQAFPRDKRRLQLNWMRTYRGVKSRHVSEVFAADADLARELAETAGARYVDFAPLAGQLRLFDDDMTLSDAGYESAAMMIAEEIEAAANEAP